MFAIQTSLESIVVSANVGFIELVKLLFAMLAIVQETRIRQLKIIVILTVSHCLLYTLF